MRKKSLVMVSLAMIFSLLLTSISYAEVTNNYVNPLMGGADPTIARAADGYYYACFSGDNNITLKRSETILGISTAKSKLVWKKPADFGYVWGPYIYRLDGKWYIYFASGPENDFGYGHPSSYVLENSNPDPFEGTWVLKGKSANADADGQVTEKEGLLNTEGYGLACGVITIKGERYFTYTKYYYFPDPKDPAKTKFDECPTIVKMENPWTLTGPECTLARPQFDWEKKNDNINEGAAVVEKDGKIYFAYSASSFMNDNYCVGVSVADAASDIMDPDSWKKYEQPIMKRSDENSSYGPGSPLFLKSEDGTEDLIVYHGIPTHGQGGGNRGIRVQRINWDENNFINPGIPSNPGTVLNRPSGEEKSEIYEAEDAKLSGVTKVAGQSAFASGAVYVKYNNSSDNDYTEFTVNTSSEGTYSLDFRYNNNTASAVDMKLEVNQDAPGNISFASNAGSYANFDIKRVDNIKLRAGSNKIRLSGNSALALDAMIIKRSSLYEAEDAEKSGNAKMDTDHPGYSGTGFVGGLWISESSITYNVNVANAGSYSIKSRYSLGFGDNIDRTLSLYVNGKKIKQMEFFDLKSWDSWADRYDNVFLKEGNNTITYKYDDGDTGNINLDYITVTEAATWHYEAESARTTGSKDAKIVQANDGNTGFGYVEGLSKANSSVEYSVNVENAASYDVKLRYANETAGKNLALYLNGVKVKDITLQVTGGPAAWTEQLETLNLKEGKNTITYKCETDNSGIISIDNIHLNKRTPWKYQAETATRSGNLKVVQDHLWYDGNGFVGGFEDEGDSIQFEVNVPNTASYTSTLRYCGAQQYNITMSMYVNDEFIKQVILPPTANWDSWNDATESVDLKAGKNIIEFIREENDTGRFNVDSLTIDKFSGGYMSSIADKIIPEKMVKIQPKHSGKALDVDRVSSDPGAVINQWANGDGNNQLWRFIDLGTGYYQIQSVQSGRLIDILAGSPIEQICQNAKLEDGSITETNQWKLEKDGDYYKLINKSNGKVMTVEESVNNGAKVMVADDQGKDNQRMRIEIRNLVDSEFRAVTDITNVPAAVKAGETVLFGTVSPDSATRKSIAWSVKDAGTTGATIEGNLLTAAKSGTVVVTAAIEEGSAVGVNYTKEFTITVTNDNAEITPESANYYLATPGDVSTTVKWNKASSVKGVVYNGNPVAETNFSVTPGPVTTEGALTIKSDYLAGLGLTNGSKAEFTISFDKGNPAKFTVNFIEGSAPAKNSITVETEGHGTATANVTSAIKDAKVVLTATPEAGYVFKGWKVISPAGLSINGNTFTMPDEAVTVKAVFISRDQPVINPESADFDLSAPSDVSTYITWNGAGSVTDVAYGTESVTGSAITVTSEGAITIKSGYLTNLGLAEGNTAEFTIFFDKENPVTFTVRFIDSSVQVSHSITVQNGEHGTANASTASAVAGTEITLTAIPDAGYRFKEWQVISPVGLAINGNTFIMPDEAVTVKPIFEENNTAKYSLTVKGSYASDSGAGSYSEGATVTINAGSYSNFRFGGWSSNEGVIFGNAGNATTTFTMPARNVTVTAEWTYNGGSTGGGNGSPSTSSGGSSSTPAPTPTVPASVVSTEKNGTSVVGKTTTEAKIDSNGNAAAAVTKSQITEAVTKAAAEAAKSAPGTAAIVEIKVNAKSDAKSVETSIPVAAINTINDNKIDELIISTPIAEITLDQKTLSGISKETGTDVKITVSKVDAATLSGKVKKTVGDAPVYDLSVKIDNRTISEFGGNIQIEIPYTLKLGEDKNAIVIYSINAEGKAEIVGNCAYDIKTQRITFSTDHSSQYVLGYNKVTFKDVAANAWYGDAVTFLAARDITTGTGGSNFGPADKLTRGQFLVMLMKAYGQKPDENSKDNFVDAGNTYYTGYLAAAKRLGITDGVGDNKYAPNKEITRQEMVALLYNALKLMGEQPAGKEGKALTDFSDAGSIAPWAKEAMTVFVEAGIVGGSDNMLTPKATTNRAQMAQILYNLLSK